MGCGEQEESIMSRERFNVRLDEFLSAQEGKNSRVMTDEDHAAAIDFILRSEDSEVVPEEGSISGGGGTCMSLILVVLKS